MSDELNDAARGLIASARRSARTLEPGRRARMRLAVMGAVGGSSLATAASMSMAKLVIVATVSAAVGSGATLMVIRGTGLTARKSEKPVSAPRATPPAIAVAPVVVAPVVAAPPPAEAPVPAPAPPPSAVAMRPSPPVVKPVLGQQPVVTPDAAEVPPETPEILAPPPAPPPPSPVSAARLAQELEMLDRALEATKLKHWAEAQQVLDEHARRFSPAALRVEARAMQVMVWCGAGRADEARALAKELERTDPLNPAVQRLRGTCVDVK